MHSFAFNFLAILLVLSYFSDKLTKTQAKEFSVKWKGQETNNGTYEKNVLENKSLPPDSALKIENSTSFGFFSTNELAKDVTKGDLSNTSLNVNVNGSNSYVNKTRQRRYNYEDKSDWNYDNEEIDYEDDKKETNSFWKNVALNWQTVALRVIQLICLLIVFICICFVCARQLFRNVCGGCIYCCETCWDKITGRDRVYRRVKEFCDQFGIKMDYDTYEEITKDLKEILEQQGVELKLE